MMEVYSTLSLLFQHDLWSAESVVSSYKTNTLPAVGEPTCEMEAQSKDALRIQEAEST